MKPLQKSFNRCGVHTQPQLYFVSIFRNPQPLSCPSLDTYLWTTALYSSNYPYCAKLIVCKNGCKICVYSWFAPECCAREKYVQNMKYADGATVPYSVLCSRQTVSMWLSDGKAWDCPFVYYSFSNLFKKIAYPLEFPYQLPPICNCWKSSRCIFQFISDLKLFWFSPEFNRTWRRYFRFMFRLEKKGSNWVLLGLNGSSLHWCSGSQQNHHGRKNYHGTLCFGPRFALVPDFCTVGGC